MGEDSSGTTERAKIWWLASYPKSGNTWLRMFLSAYRHGGMVNINTPYDLLTDDIQPYYHHVTSPCPVAELSDSERMLLRPAALLHLVHNHKCQRPLFVKTHFANCILGNMNAIPAMLTHGAVYLVRDPRDVAVSFAEHRHKDIDEVIEGMARHDFTLRRDTLGQVTSSWSGNVQSWLATRGFPVLIVEYEKLVADPKPGFRAILKFLMHEVDEDLLDRSIEATSFTNLQNQEEAYGFREKTGDRFFTRGKPGGWRDVLTPTQAARIESAHAEMMTRMGYLGG